LREHAPWPPRQALANLFVQLQDSSANQATDENTPAEQPNEEQGNAQIRPALARASSGARPPEVAA
jgi:hypothetical protein